MQACKRLTGYFGLAVAPDSNLNAASETEIIYIDTVFGRLPFTREEGVASNGTSLPDHLVRAWMRHDALNRGNGWLTLPPALIQ